MDDDLHAAYWQAADAAVGRLEDVLAQQPFDRALPDLARLLRLADVPASLVQESERARKVLHEAMLARPLGTPEAVRVRRQEVEVLLLEVGLLTDVLRRAAAVAHDADPDGSMAARARDARARLQDIRAGVAALRDEL